MRLKTLLLAAIVVAHAAPAFSGQDGFGRGDCDYIVNNPRRPDCVGYNPFHPEAARFRELARQAKPSLYGHGFTASPP